MDRPDFEILLEEDCPGGVTGAIVRSIPARTGVEAGAKRPGKGQWGVRNDRGQ